MSDDKTKRPMKPVELAALVNGKAAAEKKFGSGVVITSAVTTAKDGSKHELALDVPSPSAPKANPDFELVEYDDGKFTLQKQPPKHLRDAAHRAVGELIRELQHFHEQGELKCVAAVWVDEEETCFPVVAGMLSGETLPACLKDLAGTVLDAADGTSDDEGTDVQ